MQRIVSLPGALPIRQGVGKVKIDLFIEANMSGLAMVTPCGLAICELEPTGNGRKFKANAKLSDSKVQIELDFDTGNVTVGVNETCWRLRKRGKGGGTSLTCYAARDVSVNSYDVNSGDRHSAGKSNAPNRVELKTTTFYDASYVDLSYDTVLAGPIPPGLAPDINGSIQVNIDQTRIDVCRSRDAFPSLGIYRTTGGVTQVLLEDKATRLGPVVGLTGTQKDSGCKSFGY